LELVGCCGVESTEPQFMQNLTLSSFLAPHFGQNIFTTPFVSLFKYYGIITTI